MESLNINVSAEVNEEVEKEELQLFICPEEGYRRSFQRYGSLQNHVLYGRHDKEREKVCLIDRAKQGYAMRLEMQYGAVPSKQSSYIYVEDEDGVVTEMGWALQQQRAKTRFNVKQKEFLCKKFEEGGITGNKHKPDDVAQEMRTAKDAMGKRVFAAEEFLSSKQIASFFFRLAAKKRNVTSSDIEAMDAVEAQIELRETMIGSLVPHPVTYDDLVLCGISKEKLSRLKLEKLKNICSYLGVDATSARNKIQYVDLLFQYVQNCKCSKAPKQN